MNRHVDRLANRARARVVASHWRDCWQANHPAARIPLPFIAHWWPHVERSAPGPLSWPAYRWPLNTARWIAAHTWSQRWNGYRRPKRQGLARFVWTVIAGVTGIIALLVAAVLTALAVPVYVLANITGAGLIVFAGWASSRGSIEGLDTSRLSEWAADVDKELVEPAVIVPPPSPSSSTSTAVDQVDVREPTSSNDPHLAAQREQIETQRHATEELRRHNDLLAAPPAAYYANSHAGHHQAAVDLQAAQRARRGGWRVLGWLLLSTSIVVGLGLFFGAWMLSLAAGYNDDLQPPTFAEIQADIDEGRPPGFPPFQDDAGAGQ